MTVFHVPGFPRVGAQRELKWALEAYWAGQADAETLQASAAAIREQQWRQQLEAGVSLITAGDFALYDHVLNTSFLLGHLPDRARNAGSALDQLFMAARGRSTCGCHGQASEMTKWFDTNYHYLVPEFRASDEFHLQPELLLEEIRAARALTPAVKAVIPGPLTYLWLGKSLDGSNRLSLLPRLLPVYSELFALLKKEGIDWLQVDEPVLGLDLPVEWRQAFEPAYHSLRKSGLNLLVATYFSALQENLSLLLNLPVEGVHLDLVTDPESLAPVLDQIGPYKVLSLGIIDGRNIWRTDLDAALARVLPAAQRLGDRLWLSTSCSLLHVPYDVSAEDNLPHNLKDWLAFAWQKIDEGCLLAQALNDDTVCTSPAWLNARAALNRRRTSAFVHKAQVKQRAADAAAAQWQRHAPYSVRKQKQQALLQLPLLPTTTIGSFPQTAEIRTLRKSFRQGELTLSAYEQGLQREIEHCIRVQEQIGLDVLVHGEAERNDMVEYFGELLDGIASTANGWVQSYGSRCVKPPVIFGDIERPQAMTVRWAAYAQSLSEKWVKGMLTGPVTILKWAFVRDDQPWSATAYQIAAALRDEVADLERAGIRIIQVDEPALREALPLRRSGHSAYLNWAVNSFRYAVTPVADDTQIHTHMCYADFDDILPAIQAMDADVITLETARSASKLLASLHEHPYTNGIGPGVYDIHSPNIPEAGAMTAILNGALEVVDASDLWVNPDCGLKTRRWPEVIPALEAMVAVTLRLREQLTETA